MTAIQHPTQHTVPATAFERLNRRRQRADLLRHTLTCLWWTIAATGWAVLLAEAARLLLTYGGAR